MQRSHPFSSFLAALLLAATVGVSSAVASEGNEATPVSGSAEAPPTVLEERLEQQGALLDRMRLLIEKQQVEIERLRTEVEALRGSANSATTAAAVANKPAAPPAISAAAPAAAPEAQDDATAKLKKQVDDLNKKWGPFKLSGDVRFRYEGFYNQGFDSVSDVDPRNRFRVRVRLGLTSQINEHLDWGVRVATGSFDDPISTNQTLSEFFERHPIGLDRAYIHYASRTKPADFEAFAGKFEAPWKKTNLTFDGDLQVEGLTQSLRFAPGEDSVLRAVKLTAWELPFKERSAGADAFILGGQVQTDWKLAENWSATLAGAFHDFEQVDLIPVSTGVSPTLVNAGFEYGTTNVVIVDPVTKLPQYRSEYRVIDAIGELTYRGWDERWPLVLRLDWIHNTSAFNNQRDGGVAAVELGRRAEKGDWLAGYEYWKVEREAYPSVFMESDFLQTNGLNHRFTVSHTALKAVLVESQFILSRRLHTTSPENRWLNRLQFDVIYRF
jgi:hypothetical protein